MAEQQEIPVSYTAITFQEARSIYWQLEGRFLRGRSHKYDLDRLEEYFGKRYLHTLTPYDVSCYRAHRKIENPDLRESSLNREHTRFTRILNALAEWKELGTVGPYNLAGLELPLKNPGEAVKQADESQYARDLIVTPEMFNRFCDYAHPRIRRIVTLALLLLLRRKDIQVLEPEKLNKVLDQISGTQSKTGKPYVVPASLTVKVIFRSAEIEQREYVCDFTNYRRLMTRAKKESGVFFWLTDLRRSGATKLLEEGVDLRTIQKYLGHASLSMTEKYLNPPTVASKKAGRILESEYITHVKMPDFQMSEN